METAANHRAEQEPHHLIGNRDLRSAERFGTRFVEVYIKMVSLGILCCTDIILRWITVVTKEIISEKEARELFRM